MDWQNTIIFSFSFFLICIPSLLWTDFFIFEFRASREPVVLFFINPLDYVLKSSQQILKQFSRNCELWRKKCKKKKKRKKWKSIKKINKNNFKKLQICMYFLFFFSFVLVTAPIEYLLLPITWVLAKTAILV